MHSTLKIVDSQGKDILLGEMIGKGGEGSVYAIEGEDKCVAKLYHQRPLPKDVLDKLTVMICGRSPELESVSAWPQSLIHDPRSREVLGIVMPKISDSNQLHELYGTANRRRSYPEAKWHHLVLAARNVAAAFESLHSAGVIIGDINQGNLLVDKNMCVRFIDCDSFQIEHEGRVFPCPVGTPHFTPPELQSLKLRDVKRTLNHDGFGLAIMIFHLLFVGRHPFAGRYTGPGEMTIEKAIAEHRFAFSRYREQTQLEPPPASLLLQDLPPSLAEMFEQAFQSSKQEVERPPARAWVQELESLIKQRRPCSFDKNHIYYQQLTECPWCRIEDEGGPTFFVSDSGASFVSTGRLEELDRKIQNIQIPEFVDLSPGQLTIPKTLKPKRMEKAPRATTCDVAAAGMAASASAALLGVKWLAALLLGSAGAVGCAGYLIFSEAGRKRRTQGDDLVARFEQLQAQLHRGAHVVEAKHQARKKDFENSVEELKKAYEHYQTDAGKLEDVLAWQRTNQLNRYLSGHLIQDNVARIPGLTFSILSMLESYGVETALDVDNLKLMAVPMLAPALTMELLSWRERVEGGFKFKSEHGVSFEDARYAGERALNRFKTAQARKVLMGAKQIYTLADVGKAELNRDLQKFNEAAEKARSLANQLREFQSGRRVLERVLNSHPVATAGIALAVPALSLLIRKLFG